MRLKSILGLCAALALLTACGDDPNKPYLKIVGGGLNNALTQGTVTAVVVAKRMKALPSGSVVEADFTLPDTGKVFATTDPAGVSGDKLMFESEPLHGVKKGVPIPVKVRLLDGPGGKEIAVFETQFVPDADATSTP